MKNNSHFRNIAYIMISTTLLKSLELGTIKLVKADDSGHNSYCTERCEHGYHTFNDYYLRSADGSKNGVKYYYIDVSGFQSADIQYVLAGISEWMTIDYIKNYICLTRTYDESKAQIIIKKGTPPDAADGITAYFLNSGSSILEEPPNGNYYKTVITLQENLKTSKLRLITMHEIGHAMGLSHAWCQKYNSVMWVDSATMPISVTSFDKSNLRHIYC